MPKRSVESERRRGRPRKYKNDEERKAAMKAYQKSYREKRKQSNAFDKLFMNMGEIYKTRERLDDEQKEFIRLMFDRPIAEVREEVNRKKVSEAKKQINIALSMIKKGHNDLLEFDLTKMDEPNKEYFIRNFPRVINALMESINLSDDRYVIAYEYNGTWRDRMLTDITTEYLLNQIAKELNEHMNDLIEYANEYDFFPIQIREIKRLSIVNTDTMYFSDGKWTPIKTVHKFKEFKSLDKWKAYKKLLDDGASNDVIDKHLKGALKSKRKKASGSFWPYYLTMNELDLSRQMIFSQLDKQTAEVIEKDNCFIYACRMSGLPDEIIDDMRYSVKTRNLSFATINELASEYDLVIKLRQPDRTRWINPTGKHLVKLLLMEDHYMVNEKVDISPYYVIHKDEIMNDVKGRYLSSECKKHIIKKVNGKYVYDLTKRFSLRKVLSALFDKGYFTPITMGDFMTYSTLVCFEKIEPIKRLDYEPRYCCRLKE